MMERALLPSFAFAPRPSSSLSAPCSVRFTVWLGATATDKHTAAAIQLPRFSVVVLCGEVRRDNARAWSERRRRREQREEGTKQPRPHLHFRSEKKRAFQPFSHQSSSSPPPLTRTHDSTRGGAAASSESRAGLRARRALPPTLPVCRRREKGGGLRRCGAERVERNTGNKRGSENKLEKLFGEEMASAAADAPPTTPPKSTVVTEAELLELTGEDALEDITDLTLRERGLTSLPDPDILHRLTSLEVLSLSHNRLSSLRGKGGCTS
jgi:hypothetical protein